MILKKLENLSVISVDRCVRMEQNYSVNYHRLDWIFVILEDKNKLNRCSIDFSSYVFFSLPFRLLRKQRALCLRVCMIVVFVTQHIYVSIVLCPFILLLYSPSSRQVLCMTNEHTQIHWTDDFSLKTNSMKTTINKPVVSIDCHFYFLYTYLYAFLCSCVCICVWSLILEWHFFLCSVLFFRRFLLILCLYFWTDWLTDWLIDLQVVRFLFGFLFSRFCLD